MSSNSVELDKLLKELKDNRVDLHEMIDTISTFREKVDTLLPEKVEYRQRHLMVERMKNVTEIIKSELAVRKQIDESIKLETDMRRKSDDSEIMDQPGAIKAYAQAIELIYKDKEDDEKEKNGVKLKPELTVIEGEK